LLVVAAEQRSAGTRAGRSLSRSRGRHGPARQPGV